MPSMCNAPQNFFFQRERKLLEFLEEKRAEEDVILAMDIALTENQRQLEKHKRNTEQAEREKVVLEMQRREEKRYAELLEDRQKRNEEMMSDMRRDLKDEAEKRRQMEEEYTRMKMEHVETLNAKKIFYIEENERLSKEKCDTTLQAFYRQLQAKKVNGYNRPGGYQEYRTDMSNLKDKYRKMSGLGVMKEKKLLEFLEEKRAEEDVMLAIDNALTENQRQVEEQKRKTEQAEREKEGLEMQRREEKRNAELLEDRQKRNEEMMSDMRRDLKDEAEKRHQREEEYTRMKMEHINMQEKQVVDFEKIAEFKKEKELEGFVGGVLKGAAVFASMIASATRGDGDDNSD
ncbi:guanylate-binding protein 1-like [Lineus longissimus]|uniref:guanylate-binding protein 1-like n=1 Tax=Lineus longissimus TaxID=88925 RepID=UPI00315CE1FC